MSEKEKDRVEVVEDCFDVHVVLVSAQAAPNFLPAVEPGFQPKRVVMLVSGDMKENAGHLAKALRTEVPAMKVERVDVPDPYDLEGMVNQFLVLFDGLVQGGERIALNVTGGTKPMAIAALQAAELAEIRSFYLRLDTNRLFFLGKNRSSRAIQTRRRLRTYLMAYGYELRTRNSRSFLNESSSVISHLLTKESYREAVPKLNWLAQQAEKKLKVRNEMNDAALDALLGEFEQVGLLSVHGRDIVFPSEDARFFVNGGWLEELTTREVRKAFPEAEVLCNAEILTQNGKKPLKNEIDVMFWENDRLCLVECKTPDPKDKSFSTNLLKFSKVCSHLGLKKCDILVSYHGLRDIHRERAEKEEICVISGNDLKRLGERLKHFVWHGNK